MHVVHLQGHRQSVLVVAMHIIHLQGHRQSVVSSSYARGTLTRTQSVLVVAMHRWYRPDGVGHSVRSECAHHAQLLQRGLVLPLLRELLLLGALALHELLPALRRPLDVSVQVAEIFHVGQGLHHEHSMSGIR